MGIDRHTGVDPDDFRNNKFMAEELLCPWASHTDAIRMNMFTSNVTQAVALVHPEPPMVFTGFEKQVGSLSSAKKLADGNMVLHRKVRKHQSAVLYILRDDKRMLVKTFEVPVAKNITECFGYSVLDGLEDAEDGDEIPEGTRLIYSAEWDDEDNFSYGANLKAVFMPLWGMTYEDGVIISESAAKRMSATMVQDIKVSLNTNDILVNCYGDGTNYVPFPDVGEKVLDRVLCARRRLNYQSVYHDFASDRIADINFSTDDVFYAEGTVIDMEVYSNAPVEQLEKSSFNDCILDRLRQNTEYYERVAEALGGLKREDYALDDEAGFALQRAQLMLSKEHKFVDDGRSDFDNMILKFKLACNSPLVEGSKITGRYGNKGTVSVVLPDDQMPFADDGQQAEVILNVLGVVGRLNPGQLFEQEVNFVGNELTKRMKGMGFLEAYKLYCRFLKALMPKEQFMCIRRRTAKLSDEDLTFYMEEVAEEGIRVMIPPFHGCPDFFAVSDLYEEFDVKPLGITIPAPEGMVRPKRNVVMGNMYLMRLKHDAEGKFSARSAGALSLAAIPSKNNKPFKSHMAPYPKTAVRLGEMELVNMFALGDIEELYRFLSLYSSSEADRRELIRRLLGTDDEGGSVYSIEKVEKLKDAPSLPQSILAEYLSCMGMELVDGDGNPVVPVRRRRAPVNKG